MGFAADATQGVFQREVQASRAIMDTNFDTRGRSLALINSSDVPDEFLANPEADVEFRHALIDPAGRKSLLGFMWWAREHL